MRRLIEKTCGEKTCWEKTYEQCFPERNGGEVQVDNRIVALCSERALRPLRPGLAVSGRPPTVCFSSPASEVAHRVSAPRVGISVSGTGARTALLADLRARIAKIEQHPLRLPPSPSEYGCLPSVPRPKVLSKEERSANPHVTSIPADPQKPKTMEFRDQRREHGLSHKWLSGIEEIDQFLPAGGLQRAGLHEIKPEQPGDATAALGFALALAAQHTRNDAHRHAGGIVWVQPVRDAGEYGRPYGLGLAPFGLDPASLVVVEPKNLTEALWAIEESLKGDEEGRDPSLALVLACLTASTNAKSTKGNAGSRSSPACILGATAQRRLSLAAARGGTPCLLLTSHASPGLGAAHTRWRVGRQPSRTPRPVSASVQAGPGGRGPTPRSFPLHGQFPAQGHFQVRIRLERCRGTRTMMGSEGRTFDLEWCDAAYRFRLLAALADRTPRDPVPKDLHPRRETARTG